MFRTLPDRRALARHVTAGAFVAFLVAGTACASDVRPGSSYPSTTPPSVHMTTYSPTGTPNLSPSVRPDLARAANAIALEWFANIGGLPMPDVVYDAPAALGPAPERVAVKLKFPRQVTLPPGIPMVKSLGEEGSKGSIIVKTTEPRYGTTAVVIVDIVTQRLRAVIYIGASHGSP